MYIDGKPNNPTKTGTIGNIGSIANSVNIRLASESDGGSYFDGQLDDLKLFRYGLTFEQVKTLYNNGAASFN